MNVFLRIDDVRIRHMPPAAKCRRGAYPKFIKYDNTDEVLGLGNLDILTLIVTDR